MRRCVQLVLSSDEKTAYGHCPQLFYSNNLRAGKLVERAIFIRRRPYLPGMDWSVTVHGEHLENVVYYTVIFLVSEKVFSATRSGDRERWISAMDVTLSSLIFVLTNNVEFSSAYIFNIFRFNGSGRICGACVTSWQRME